MADEDKMANPNTIPLDLKRWAEGGDPDDTRTVVFRIAPNADVKALCGQLAKLQVTVTSAGAEVIVGTISKRELAHASQMPEIIRIEEPTRLSLKDSDGKADFLSYDGRKGVRLPDS